MTKANLETFYEFHDFLHALFYLWHYSFILSHNERVAIIFSAD